MAPLATVWLPGPLRVEVHLGAEQTGGALCLLVDHPAPGWSLPPHRHRREAETIHVVEGEFDMVVDGRRSLLGPGDTVHVPAGVTHSGGNVGAQQGRRIVTFTPGGLERFFLEAGVPSPEEEREPRELLQVAVAHGWDFG